MLPSRDMFHQLKKCLYAGTALIVSTFASNSALAAIADTPLFLTQSAKPQVMLAMSNDHQLYYKAYDDYSDVDGDGTVDTTYKNSIDYYGYFDSYKCYDYDTTDNRFEPASVTVTKYCAGNWSGNFLNWATMTRIDTVRKILYGGLRSTDTSAVTVLERSFLPHDAHSFAKYYNGVDMNQLTPFSNSEITICNTTASSSSTAYSQAVTDPPLMRVAAGNFMLWASNERWQCRWREEQNADNGNNSALSGLTAASRNPYRDSGDTNGDTINPDAIGEKNYRVRVVACDSSLLGEENCKRYPNGNYKPIGLLQTHGDDGYIDFGLITGSYAKSKSGGVLRKNVGTMTNEVNVTTDGTFKTVPAGGGIINTLNKLRIFGYYYGDGTYNPRSGSSDDDCNWGWSSFSNGQCSNWGNPLSEIYLEALRYFAGKTVSSAFSCDDSTRISGLTTATWSDPLSNANWCSPLNIIAFNASSSSYDGDELGGAANLGISSLDDLTDAIGDAELISGNDFFIGKNGTNNNGLCTAKTIDALSDASGTCPDSPRLDGSYQIAGLAHFARTNSIRTDLSTDEQQVMTYGVALSPAVPKIVIPVPSGSPGQVVTILPSCRNDSVGGNCAIVDFKIVQAHTDLGGGVWGGKVYVNWEDSEQGGDYDQDMWGTLSYAITSTTITVSTDVHAQSTPYAMGFGYVISGTTHDGFHAHSGINNFDHSDAYAGLAGCTDCIDTDAATAQAYTIGTSGAGLLEQPLYYTAKWGGFEENDDDANLTLDQDSEWDANGDGVPDKYYYSTNPAELETALSNVFLSVAAAKSSSASIVADSVTLETGTHIYQAQFDSSNWTGTVQAFPLDMDGNIGAAQWSAQEQVDTTHYDTGRTILTYRPGTAAGDGPIAFRWASLSAAQQTLLNTNPVTAAADALGADRLNYLRGDTSEELRNGSGSFRNRDSRLGDIVSSTPFYVSRIPAFNYSDAFIDEANTATYYSDFRDTIQALNGGNGRLPMLYVGANDGMLHGFRADTGEELIAYVPNALMSKLPALTHIDYGHQYYVDGAPTAGDVYGDFPACATPPCWRTMLTGGLAAGGKAIYALDVTDPEEFDELYPANQVLWEISNTTTGFSELGYTFSQPGIVHMANGQFAVVFGNGYSSANGKAVLYIVNAVSGALIKAITLDNTSGAGNGLSTVSPIDADGNRTIDYIFAGDLKGNVWKVDVTGSNSSQWGSAFTASGKPAPLFVALDYLGVRQPITAQLEVSKHSTGTGFQVYFGTGKYFETGDNNPTGAQRQTFYGIWDKNDGTRVGTRAADLLQQQIIYEISETFTNDDGESFSYDLRVTTDNDINWRVSGATTPNHLGWYLDLIDPSATVPGERVIHQGFLRGGRIIFTTLIPSLHSCDYGGTGWLMELDAESGSRLDVAPWDLNQDGLFNAGDYVTVTIGGESVAVPPSGKKSKVGIIQKPTVISAGTKEYKYASGSKDAAIEKTDESTSGAGRGRSSWRQLR
ncbi:MAG: PilC/PilY family type IV pilus protein [Pseudomonadota bacterium]